MTPARRTTSTHRALSRLALPAAASAIALGVSSPAVAAPTATTTPTGTSTAAADPLPVGAGTRIKVRNTDGEVGQGACNVAAVGHDRFGNRVALTAGHCGEVGFTMIVDGRDAGTFATSKTTSGGRPVTNRFDYAFVTLDDHVVMQDDPASPVDVRSVVAPTRRQFPVCKYGHGLLNEGERCGVNVLVTQRDFVSTYLVSAFDSGSPVYVERTKLIGIVSRFNLLPLGVTATRADAAIADATADGSVGAGFVPVA